MLVDRSSHHPTKETMSNTNQTFPALDHAQLDKVAGGAARVTARSSGADAEIKSLLTGVTDSIKGLANQKPSGMDPMMMMMMMMMGGGGGGAAPAPAAPPPPPPKPIVNITNSVSR
jgi:hypothetical protein